MPQAGVQEQRQLFLLKRKQLPVHLPRQRRAARPMLRVVVVIQSAAVVKQGKELNNAQIRAGHGGKLCAVLQHPAPVADPMSPCSRFSGAGSRLRLRRTGTTAQGTPQGIPGCPAWEPPGVRCHVPEEMSKSLQTLRQNRAGHENHAWRCAIRAEESLCQFPSVPRRVTPVRYLHDS